MTVRVGINGFGRIGRQVLRAMLQRCPDTLEVVAINDLVDAQMNAYLFKYDTNYGVYPGTVEVRDGEIAIDGHPIRVFAERDPGRIPWREVGVELVVESTGLFTDAQKARAHLDAGAKRVIISAPAKNEDLTVVLGVNEDRYDPARHRIVSNASCTTNGLAPVARVLHEEFGIEKGILTTVHAYTNSQRLLDVAAKDPRDARAAAMNIVPSETGAARAVGLVIPELQGKFTGMAFRVPVSTVSVIDFTVLLRRQVTREEVNGAVRRWAEERIPEILGYTEEPLVSSDLKGDSRSSIFSGLDTLVVGGNLVKVVSWYDNEWGYACRVADLARYMAERGV
ncbi:MAG: type I glyceraldehyde-3-phosphate dehydrogenase [Armatimonadota bacterium]|nr:type I glyceraldehyde-3-phosphate dehydrogenase [Armatimonadota bacterium]MDR5674858.1 type I glyceraldehyde-3-phosphate dehydrogenase [Armatimonadota bacterium]MDR5688361.1 type I glyceraldehyde-3-phosphate dehydrogenase [Armatimonadota bacterium]MDR7386737.1 type I glyceraldehyde-3-phosphate dehydrogenase [Armatimonadota bacterium]MDR7388226.1 type I glyceraldehyde-3-phosphate dehydrogenase [Armatimonadota bacterium]